MTHHYLFGFLILTACCLLHVSSRPSNNDESIDYYPFYGGAKGQYLEVKKNNRGNVISEKIVSEENISSENIVKNNNENLISKVLAANLKTLRSLSDSLLKLHALGTKTGLSDSDRDIFKTQLSSLGEAVSNSIKIVDEIGDNIDLVFKKGGKKQFIDDVGEEGVGIESPEQSDEVLSGTTIAEAKPVGLAVIGENGLAASRPVATAIAASGIALARPIATAIAGVDPAALGIQFQVNQSKH